MPVYDKNGVTPNPTVGEKIETWFSGQPDGMSTVLAVAPYRGKYKHLFTHTLRVTAPRTRSGSLEICVDVS